MSDLKISVLGRLEIAGGDAGAITSLTRKTKAVAAYLALQRGQPQARDRIAALFWEDSPGEQARTNLRQCLSALRKHFDRALVATADEVYLDPAAVDLDAERFESLIAHDHREPLEEAAAIYRGDLLDGFSVKEDAFEAWIRVEREHYRTLMVDGLLRLVNRCEEAKDFGAAIRFATRLQLLDPLNERIHRSLMRAYAAQGRHDAALKQFKTCRDMLERELGVQPQAQTRALHDTLRAERRSLGAVENDAAPVLNVTSEFDALGVDFSLPSKPSIILMPIKDLSSNGAHGHLATGLRIDMQSALVKISGLFVIAAGSAAIYNDQDVGPEKVAHEMGVRHVLECTIQGSDEQIRVNAQLCDGVSGQIVWSERYDRKLDGNFLIQDEIVEKIVASLDVELVGGEQARVWRKTLRDPKALEFYYKGLELLAVFDKQNVALARTLFERVAKIAPNVTLGPTCVAFCHYWDATKGWSTNTDTALDEAVRWSEKAATMEDADGQAHAILAHVKLLRGQHDEALEIAEEAIRIRPLCANTNALSGNILLYCGRPTDAIDRVKLAIRLAPVYASWWVEILAFSYMDAGQTALAIAAASELLRKAPDSIAGLIVLTSALVADKRLQTAQRHAARILALEPGFSLSKYALQHPYQDGAAFKRRLAMLRKAGLPS